VRTGYRQDQGITTFETFKNNINQNGEVLTVTPPQALANIGVPIKTLRAIVEAPNAGDTQTMKQLGVMNIDSAAVFTFTFPGDSGIVENSTLCWQGFTYKLATAYAQPFKGYNLGIRCIGLRENPLPGNILQTQRT
jgi:hypothetical protein